MAQRRVIPDVHCYSVVINGLCKIKMMDEAMNLFKEMQNKKHIPDAVTYSSLIDGMCKSGRISHAWELLEEMHDRGQHANVITYSSLLHALCKNHDVGEAIALVKKIKDQGIQPDMHTYNILMDGLCKQGRFQDAQVIFYDLLIKGYKVTVPTYNIMIHGLCLGGLFDEAEALLSKMEDNGCIPDAGMNNPRVFHVTSYGADPTGNSDSTEALFAAIADAAMQSNGLQKGHLLEAIKNLAGAQINLEGGNYMISRSLKFPAALGTSWYVCRNCHLFVNFTFA
ncbi:hypothetical protein TSUD_292390 [Trifolium subterraneum]|uniref:Pentatricopeptide repeat-containing protein n=1 Tax=Trifolium subterraneum TaxID=3900 RepID=A0A2Z6P816_TRISU|nr:hypothetical protein TSUD_292390 [Trifolium subterraneum]